MLQGDLNFWLSLLFGLAFFYLLTRLFFRPARFFVKLFVKIFVGAVLLLLINLVLGAVMEFQIAINAVTALVVGFLGLPGIVLLIVTILLIGAI